MKIKIDKFFDDIKTPERAHYNDSGADVFSPMDCVINPGSVYAMPLGFGVQLPDGYDIVLHCKSGLSKKGLFVLNSPVDSGYRSDENNRAEIHAILYNSTTRPFEIKKGSKVAQLVVRPVIYADFVDELGEERGEGAFGSTGI